MRCLVTGAGGFLGGHLVRALRARGDFVAGLHRDAGWGRLTDRFIGGEGARAREAAPSVTLWGDLGLNLSSSMVERAIADYQIDTVFHLAAQTQVSTAESDPRGTFDANVCGTQAVLEACRQQKVKHYIQASSDKVYGDGPAPYAESQPVSASGHYATTKAMADLLAQAYARDFKVPVAITRCGNLYGPGFLNFSTLIAGAIKSAIRGERFVIRSDGMPRRDYLHVADAVDGYLRLADQGAVGIFNFGTGRPSSALEVVRAVEAAVGGKLDVEVLGGAAGEIRDQWLDAGKARKVLEWKPSRGLDTGLRETVPWYREFFGRAAAKEIG